MAVSTQRHGNKGQIRIGAGSPLTIIGSISGWNVSFTKDKVETTSLGDNNKRYLVGLKDISGTVEAFYDITYIRHLMDAADDDDGSNIRITPSTLDPTFYYEGPCWIDITNSGAVNDAVKVSMNFAANGDWILQVDGSPV